MTDEQRKVMLKQVVELSQHIVIGKVIGSKCYKGSSGICTRYSIEVLQSIKGDSRAGDVLRMYQPGGAIGDTSRWVEHWEPLEGSRSYLLYLSACPGDINSKPFNGLTGMIRGDYLTPVHPPVPIAVSVLVDSIRGLCRVADVARQARSSGLVVEGILTRLGPGREIVPVKCAVLVGKVVMQHAGPPVDECRPLPFELPAVEGVDAAIQGTRPVLHEGSPYLMFLNWTGTGWSLRPTAYAAWKKDGSVGFVRGRPLQCPSTAEITVASAPWDTLLMKARE